MKKNRRIGLKLLIAFVLLQIVGRFVRKNWHFPAPAFLGYFLDSDCRRFLQPPDKLIARSGVAPGMRVLEVGCGSGAFTTFVARAVGPAGQVAALDIQPAMLRQLETKLARPEHRDLRHVTLHEGDAHALPFDDDAFDLVYMVTVFQEIPDRDRALAEARRVLKPGGYLAITEFLPDPDYPLRATTIRQGEAGGFALDAAQGNLWNYTVRFVKPYE